MKNVEEVIWTDGPSSEFKNRFMAHLLQELSTKYKKIFKWKFFATSHGKGIVDGIGGRAKSIVRYKTRSQGDTAPIVQSAKDFADLVSSLMPNTKVFLIPQLDISQRTSWEEAPLIHGIKSMHIIIANPNVDYVSCYPNALASVFTTS